MKLKLYKYPHAPEHLHDRIPGYENSVPFSKVGIEKHCELVDDPKKAELFYCGQFNDMERSLILPNVFDHFAGNEERHVFDIEGDEGLTNWQLPHYLQKCIFTAMNALPNHRNMNVFVRPGCSMLLKNMVANPRVNLYEPKRGFYFRGQIDRNWTRLKVKEAFEKANVPGVFEFTNKWHCPTPASDPEVRQYEEGMTEWKYALCPAGYGESTQRYYEAVMLGRTPVVIANNLVFEDDLSSHIQLSPNVSVDQLVRWIKIIYDGGIIESRGINIARLIQIYFADPTFYFINWMKARGII